MKKASIKKVLDFKGGDKDIKVAVDRVLDTLNAIPDEADLGAMTSVEEFERNNAFGIFNFTDTRLDNSGDRENLKKEILGNLKSILLEVTSWIKDNPLQVKYNIISTNQKKDRTRRKWLIAVLVIVAAAAIALTIIQKFTSIIPEGVPIGEIVGLVDLIIGIIGFIYELADDNKKEAVCNAVQEMSDSKNDEALLESAEKYVKAKHKNIMLCFFHIGTVQQIGEQTINNYRRGK